MSIFYTENLEGAVETTIRIKNSLVVKHVRVHVYRSDFLNNGQLKLTILEGLDEINTAIIDYTDINSISPDSFIHGWIRFDIPTVLHRDFTVENTDYTFKVEMINYTPTTESISIVTDLNPPTVDVFDSISIYSRGFEIYADKQY